MSEERAVEAARLTDRDLQALIDCYADNRVLFRDQVVDCLKELQTARAYLALSGATVERPADPASAAQKAALAWLDYCEAPSHARAIKAMLKRPADPRGWQTMESAPKDGRDILWCTDRGDFMKKRFLYEVIRWPTYKECFEEGFWQPLPLSPAPKDREGG